MPITFEHKISSKVVGRIIIASLVVVFTLGVFIGRAL